MVTTAFENRHLFINDKTERWTHPEAYEEWHQQQAVISVRDMDNDHRDQAEAREQHPQQGDQAGPQQPGAHYGQLSLRDI